MANVKAIQMLDSGCMVNNSYILLNNKPLLKKPENKTKRSLTQLWYYFFAVLYFPKLLIILQKSIDCKKKYRLQQC